MRCLLFAGLLLGCASAGSPEGNSGTDASTTDAPAIDAGLDAPLPCTEITTELLNNPAFDSTPMGTGWMETRIQQQFPLITDEGDGVNLGIAEQSAPYQAWLGGLPSTAGPTTDVLWQDITVPARTRLLLISGFYEVRTGETQANAVDTGSIAWVTTGNSPIATILALDNTKKTTTFTTLNYGLADAPMYSGMTIRLRLTSTNNPAPAPPPNPQLATSFFFDTLSVKATHCMP